jgi:hypothetical protein
MALDPESRKKIQIFLLLAIVVAGGRAAYIVYSRHQDRKEAEEPKKEVPLNADYYVRPRKLRPYDLEVGTGIDQAAGVGEGRLQLPYYPYSPARRKADFGHEAGTLGPLQSCRSLT